MRAAGKVRIIGGEWRGRRLTVADRPGVRPTPDRIRETLFNWLAAIIPGACCLDLFAGTGVLGFEALSRGARRAVMVEQDKQLVRGLEQARSVLAAERARIIHAEAFTWLATKHEPFDVVFLDPPFRREYVKKACALLTNRGHLAPAAHVYTESEQGAPSRIPGLTALRVARAGQVEYRLYQYNVGES